MISSPLILIEFSFLLMIEWGESSAASVTFRYVSHDAPAARGRDLRSPIVCASCRIRLPLDGLALTEEGVEGFDLIEE